MYNIIKSQLFIIKQKSVSLTAVFIAAVVAIVTGFLLNQNAAEVFSQPGLMALFVVLFIPVIVLCYSYSERIQMYEVMAGFRPHKIIFGKLITLMPVLLLYGDLSLWRRSFLLPCLSLIFLMMKGIKFTIYPSEAISSAACIA